MSHASTVDQIRVLAKAAHGEQVDKMGRPYFEHHVSGVAARLVEGGTYDELIERAPAQTRSGGS